ncbi:3-oxoacyl-[acyl-carrier-protein] synthase III, chloroplastic-like isoform X2 [Hibiscus syriacus]|uniref:3-oxoacyl-[acyl-carrier-protein] synthase III, chloroplastic-like isoform X2 n=1 Tax=Hibiscus syriacus TaxID=106335 RepID=UPI001921BE15|nr:3-oxoacyl-[acyl-carrier-protein] synthase III, chloroplastic-like isoform X2 [Hibiscus syriacus]
MANASGFFTPSVPKLRTKVQPSIGISGSGFGFSRRVVCSSAIEGAEKHVSPLESRVPKLVSKGCKLVGCGSAVLSLSVSNDDLSKIVDTNDEWISVRTGIRNRRVISGKPKDHRCSRGTVRVPAGKSDIEPGKLR